MREGGEAEGVHNERVSAVGMMRKGHERGAG